MALENFPRGEASLFASADRGNRHVPPIFGESSDGFDDVNGAPPVIQAGQIMKFPQVHDEAFLDLLVSRFGGDRRPLTDSQSCARDEDGGNGRGNGQTEAGFRAVFH